MAGSAISRAAGLVVYRIVQEVHLEYSETVCLKIELAGK